MIELKNVSFDYILKDENGNEISKKTAVKNLSLTIDTGSFVCIVGRNGSGKSTLARMINGILTPTEGAVLVNGRKPRDYDIDNFEDYYVGMVFQNPDNQIVASVVEEDVAFGLENLGIETEEMIQRIDNALQAVDMKEYKYASPNKLSGGQKQRVALAGALAIEPKYLVLDEPTSMLDPKGRKEIINTLIKLNKEKHITIILITHYMDEVIFADKIFVMNNGEIKLEGTPREVFSNEEMINDLGLELPFATKMCHEIKKDGYNIRTDVLNTKELIECL